MKLCEFLEVHKDLKTLIVEWFYVQLVRIDISIVDHLDDYVLAVITISLDFFQLEECGKIGCFKNNGNPLMNRVL